LSLRESTTGDSLFVVWQFTNVPVAGFTLEMANPAGTVPKN